MHLPPVALPAARQAEPPVRVTTAAGPAEASMPSGTAASAASAPCSGTAADAASAPCSGTAASALSGAAVVSGPSAVGGAGGSGPPVPPASGAGVRRGRVGPVESGRRPGDAGTAAAGVAVHPASRDRDPADLATGGRSAVPRRPPLHCTAAERWWRR